MFSRRRSLFDFTRARLAKGTRRKQKRTENSGAPSKQLRVETLEDRRMLAVLNGPVDDLDSSNDTQLGAQFVGSEPTVTISDFTVGDVGVVIDDDADFFRYVAHSTGKLIVTFDGPNQAGFGFDVRDTAGVSQLGGVVQGDGTRVLPVVEGETYIFVALDTDLADGLGGVYDASLVNIPTISPVSVSLSPGSDTGVSNSDGITSDSTPTFFIQADLESYVNASGAQLIGAIDPAFNQTGYEVLLITTNLDTGAQVFGDASRVGNTTLWSHTTSLADGDYLVSAQIRVTDVPGATGFSELAPPTFVTIDAVADPIIGGIDLAPSSDSGMVNTDNVTNKDRPAFQGFGPANSMVRVFATPTNPTTGAVTGLPILVATGTVGSDGTFAGPADGLGAFQIETNELIDGRYNISAQFETDAGLSSPFIDLAAQTFTSAPALAIPDNGVVVTDPINVAGIPALGPGLTPMVDDINVEINITHPNVGDLQVALIDPTGEVTIPLVLNRGGAGDNFTGTNFDDSSPAGIATGIAPFTGVFTPEMPLSGFVGLNPNGTWLLQISDTSTNGDTGVLNSWNLQVSNSLTIDTVEPNTPFLDLTTDTGRNNTDEITMTNLPTFVMRSNATGTGGPTNPFANDVKYRLFVRPDGNIGAPETLIYDSFTDATIPGGTGFTTLASLTRTVSLTLNNSAGTVIPDGKHDFILEIEDRAGNISHDFLLPVTIDSVAPPVSFGLTATAGDGLFDGSDTGVTGNPTSFADRVTSDANPTLWGIAEANSIVQLFHDTTGNGFSADDTFLGQTVANPLDGNLAFPTGYWQISSALNLNALNGGDGALNLLAVAQDVAGNVDLLPPTTNVDTLTIFLDTQGPRITGVSVNTEAVAAAGGYDLFDPKPSVNGPSPLVNSITINFADLPLRSDVAGTANDFIYPALDPTIAGTIGNYSVAGDHVGPVVITGAAVNQAVRLSGTVTAAAAAGATTVTDAGLAAGTVAGDFIVFNNGAANGLTRRITNVAGGVLTIDGAFGFAQAVGDGFSIVPAASILNAGALIANSAAQSTITSTANTTTTFTAANLGISAVIGDYVYFNTGANAGQIRLVTATALGGTAITVANALASAPAIGDTITLIDSAAVFGITALNTASITLTFATPLPDDRFTVTVSDNLVDPVGNKLDGESNATTPTALPTFPTGDGATGGAFAGRFTIDTRPEIGSFVSQNINIDTNGNFVWDPANAQIGGDATNVDLTFNLPVANANGSVGLGGYGNHDLAFAGKFGTSPVTGLATGFDTLAAYGWSSELGARRWLIDVNHDGVITTGTDLNFAQADLTAPFGFNEEAAIPIAGNFDGNTANGDEIGLYYAGNWALDLNRSFTFTAGEFINGNLFGHPIVGDFDGNGEDDLGVFNNNQFFFDMNAAGFDGLLEAGNTINWGFPGVLDRPVAADMDQDGIDDIGLWVPRNSAQDNRPIAEWYFLVSGNPVAVAPFTGTTAAINHAFTPVPFGNDLYAEFGDELALPIVGNFDPPVTAVDPNQNDIDTGDFDQDGDMDGSDFLAWQRGFNMSGSPSMADGDGNSDGVVDQADMQLWVGAYQAGSIAALSANDTSEAVISGTDFLQWQREESSPALTAASSAPTADLAAAATGYRTQFTPEARETAFEDWNDHASDSIAHSEAANLALAVAYSEEDSSSANESELDDAGKSIVFGLEDESSLGDLL